MDARCWAHASGRPLPAGGAASAAAHRHGMAPCPWPCAWPVRVCAACACILLALPPLLASACTPPPGAAAGAPITGRPSVRSPGPCPSVLALSHAWRLCLLCHAMSLFFSLQGQDCPKNEKSQQTCSGDRTVTVTSSIIPVAKPAGVCHPDGCGTHTNARACQHTTALLACCFSLTRTHTPTLLNMQRPKPKQRVCVRVCVLADCATFSSSLGFVCGCGGRIRTHARTHTRTHAHTHTPTHRARAHTHTRTHSIVRGDIHGYIALSSAQKCQRACLLCSLTKESFLLQ